MKKNNLKIIIFYGVLIAVLIFAASTVLGSLDHDGLSYSDVLNMFRQEQVSKFTIDETNNMTIEAKDGNYYTYKLRDLSLFWHDAGDLIEAQYASGTLLWYDLPAPVSLPWWVSYLPYVFLILILVVFWLVVVNQMNGKGGKISSFGKARAKMGIDEKKRVYFRDVAGADEEKEELKEVVEFLKDPPRFSKLGAKIPHGVLLVGPPGTGKTLLAKAVAGEAGVPFYSLSGSDFVEMYVGVGASRVRDLFDNAKKHPAAIIFIDEIDAVGRHRGAGLGGGHDEREQTLNQLLVEMDGFGSNDGVIVIAATNRPDILDPALLRPGRFDRQITVSYPDVRGREDILKVHAKGKPFEDTVDLAKLARITVGFTGADLANLLNESALLAARRGKALIGTDELEEAMRKVTMGPAKHSHVVREKDKRLTAYHEAGHAVVGYIADPDNPVHEITVVPRGRAAGYTMQLPREDREYMTKKDMLCDIQVFLGGRVAEQITFDDISTGASNDLQRATRMARSMVMRYGMSETIGSVVYGGDHNNDEVFLGRDFSSGRDYSEQTAASIDAEVRSILQDAYASTEKILKQYHDKLEMVAEYLITHETMDGEQFRAVMEGNPTVEELEAMLEDKRRRSEEENRVRAEKIEKERLAKEEAERNRIADEAYRHEHPEAAEKRTAEKSPHEESAKPQNSEDQDDHGQS